MFSSRCLAEKTGMKHIMIRQLSAILLFTFLTGCAPKSGEDGLAIGQTAEPLAIEKPGATGKTYFEPYILRAIDYLAKNYRLLGYDITKEFTHDLPFGPKGLLKHTGPKTMCVAAQLEIVVTALDIYARETGDQSPYEFLPKRAWEGYTINDLKGHMWVESKFDSFGGADALKNFGMGELVPFEELVPGSLLNWDRTSNVGHAAVLISFIDINGKEYEKHNSSVVGFKYFSGQGKSAPGTGGLDYRYAIFSKHGCPDTMPYLRDCGVIYTKNRKSLNTGRMWAPSSWEKKRKNQTLRLASDGYQTKFNAEKFSGETTD